VWAKKIRGKLHYFGPWDDPDGALTKYLEQKDALHAGCTPRPNSDAFAVKEAVNVFLSEKKHCVASGDRAVIREASEQRSTPKNATAARLAFIAKHGNGWNDDSTVTHDMRKLLNGIGINGHRNFYRLRHTCRTIADESKDQPAADHIIGHARDDMASTYRGRIDDARVRAGAEHVRNGLFVGPWKE
jgi:hypothetical protein